MVSRSRQSSIDRRSDQTVHERNHELQQYPRSDPEHTVLRKMIANRDLEWLVALEIPEGDEKSSVYLHHFDLQACKTVSSVEYVTLNSNLRLKKAETVMLKQWHSRPTKKLSSLLALPKLEEAKLDSWLHIASETSSKKLLWYPPMRAPTR